MGQGEHVFIDLEAGSVQVQGLWVVVKNGVDLRSLEDLLHKDCDGYEPFFIVRKDQL